jgi:hypothetical protein
MIMHGETSERHIPMTDDGVILYERRTLRMKHSNREKNPCQPLKEGWQGGLVPEGRMLEEELDS